MRKLISILFLLIFITGCQTGVVITPELPKTEGEFGGGERMAKKVLMVVAQADFQPVEYADTRAELENAGIDVKVASFEVGEAIGADGSKINVDIAIKDVNTNDYDAVVLIGGPGASKELIGNQDVIELVQSADNDHKVVAAICIAPVVLAEARLITGREATVWNEDGNQEEILSANGAKYVEKDVVVDNRIITANGPAAAKEFGKEVARVVKEGIVSKKI
ncbi:DJ-1/PfpI family protein [Candidatus Woesearchaeota archaeon]|nr:DJ-1/PfpI family protein [Candidatus Woesearchaeota archaeon]